jgi:Tfp pilus assembly protein PilX
MNRLAERRPHGVALIMTLALMIFLAAMIAVVIRGNLAQRKYLRLRRSGTAALYRAESGVAFALREIAVPTEPASGVKTIMIPGDDGRKCEVEWREESSRTRIYEIRSSGLTDADDPAAPRRTVIVRAQIAPRRPPRILSWGAVGE